tara:strand:+ start:407 stop:2284 length:1878 start_codon:yes stop_codon:yes gene_type:complete
MIQENEKDVKPHLPESNPGETSDFVKNNARFAAHAEETLDSMVSGFEVETLPEFLRDEGVALPNKEVDENISDNKLPTIDKEMDSYFGSKPGELEEDELNEYKWRPRADGNSRTEVAKVYNCEACDGDGTVVDEKEDDAEVIVCEKCLGSGHVDAEGNPVRIGFGPREDEVVTGKEEELETEKPYQMSMFEELGKDGKKPAVPYSKSTQADLDQRIANATPPKRDKRDHNDADEGEVARHLRHMRQLSGLKSTHDDVDEAIDAPTRVIKDKELNDYLDRILSKDKQKTDKYKLPYVHRSNVKNYIPIVDPEGKRFDLDKLAADITERPKTLLKQNEKMQHSDGTTSIFYNIGLPALTGLGYDEEKKEFVIINTCPGAGECKTFCYALKGGYVQWAPVSLSQTRILNYLYNDPSGFFDQLNAEIDEQKRKGDAKQEKHKVTVRWHDAGDFFSDEYLDLAYKLAATHPTVDFYAYTKRADVSGSTQNRPPNFMINFSMGARKAEEKRVDFGVTKHSSVVPKDIFSDLLKKDGNRLVKGPDGEWQWNSPKDYQTFKERMAAKYSIDPKSIITYDEMMKTPYGGGGIDGGVADGDRSFKRGIYNVIVKPGDGDDSANRADVLGTYLLMH